MSTATFGLTGALRTLRKLTGEELFEIWTQGDHRSRWGSLSARNQTRWDDLATWVSEHAITEIDVTDRVLTAAERYPERTADQVHRSYPHENLSDDDIAREAENFLKGINERTSAASPAQVFSQSGRSDDGPRTKDEADLSAAIDALGPVITALLKKLLS